METTFSRDWNAACTAVESEIGRTLQSIDPTSLERLKNDILDADQVFLLAAGNAAV